MKPQWRVFCREISAGRTPAEAYQTAYPESGAACAKSAASRLLRRPPVRVALGRSPHPVLDRVERMRLLSAIAADADVPAPARIQALRTLNDMTEQNPAAHPPGGCDVPDSLAGILRRLQNGDGKISHEQDTSSQ